MTRTKGERINQNRDFRRIYTRGKRWAGRYCILFITENEFQHNRIAIVCSKKVGNAVTRNKARRRLKEIIRLHRGTWPATDSRDLVIVARAGIKAAHYRAIEKDLLALLRKAGF